MKPRLKERYCLPEEPSGEFVYHMEDVLDVYTRPYDPRRPRVCLDETSVQLIGEKRIPVPMLRADRLVSTTSMSATACVHCSW